ncbi:MAG TPA: DNA primase [Bacillota bacterium]
MTIQEETIAEIRTTNDIVDVVSEYVQLKKQGRNFFGLCPFHNEKTPSFSVTQEKQIFHCFGCGKGGNVITFIMEMEGFNFIEAIQLLARRSGIQLPKSSLQQRKSSSGESQNLLSAYEWLTKLYHHLLRHTKDGEEGYQYIKDRGLTDETIDIFQLGFSPNVKNFTATFLEKKGFHRQLLVKSGILTEKDHQVIDRFQGRVIFPIRNHLGKTVGFGGRMISGEGPKYLNSSENSLFHKGNLLYNFDLARKYIRKQNEVVLFEGYMDVIASYQAGVKNVVATLGTALTIKQARMLRRYVDTVIICFDTDQAGIEGTFKAAKILRKAGCEVKVAQLEDGLDPDSYIVKYGANSFQQKVIEASETFVSFYINYLKGTFNLSLEGDRIKYIEKVTKQLATVKSSIEREYYLRALSKQYDVSMETLLREVEKFQQQRGLQKDKSYQGSYTNNVRKIYQSKKLRPAYHNAERQLIAYMLQDRWITDKVQEELGASFNVDDHKIIATHLYAFYEEGQPADVSLFVERLEEERLKKLVTEIAMIPLVENISEQEIADYMRVIQAETTAVPSIESLKEQQKIAEQQQNPLKAAEIAMQIIELQKELKQLN